MMRKMAELGRGVGQKILQKMADPEMRKGCGGRPGRKRSRKMGPENGSGKHPFDAVGSAKKWPYFEGPARGPEMMRKMADLGCGLGEKFLQK